MNITLNIVAENPTELKEAIAGLAGIVNSVVVENGPAIKEESEKQKRSSRSNSKPEKQTDQEPVKTADDKTATDTQDSESSNKTSKAETETEKDEPKQEDQQPDDTAQEDAPAEKADKPNATLEEVRAKLASLSQAGKQAQVKELITKFGASKLSDIPESKYGELLVAAEEIA